MSERKYRVSFALSDDEYRELWVCAAYRHIGGANPVSAFAKEATFGYMAKYAIPEAKKALIEKRYDEGQSDAPAVQPEGNGELFR